MLEDFREVFQEKDNTHTKLVVVNVVIFLIMASIMVVSKIVGSTWVSDAVMKEVSLPASLDMLLLRPWTIFTYALVHSLSDILHIFVNMVILFWFGRILVEFESGERLLEVYILGALAGGLLYLIAFNTIPYFIQHREMVSLIGASAAIYAVVVAAATLFPNYCFYLLFVGDVRIKYIAAIYVVVSFIGTVEMNSGGNIAHLGGAAIGYFYAKNLRRQMSFKAWVIHLLDRIKSPFRPKKTWTVHHGKNSSQPHAPSQKQKTSINGISQAELDAILDKISEAGYASLTSEEKEKLFRASEE